MNLTYFDIFAGCGGFSLGFHNAGFKSIGMLEIDEWACDTLKYNFTDISVLEKDICKFDLHEYFSRENRSAPDVIIGGPPCQGYSLCRRGKGDPFDPRNRLVFEFLKTVEQLSPQIFIMENVANLIKSKNIEGILVKDVLREEFEQLGYNFHIKVLNASDFGVPQNRNRCFIIGTKNYIEDPYPKITHQNSIQKDLFNNLKNTPTLWDAISDLPELSAGGGGEEFEYENEPVSVYAKKMRDKSKKLFNHKAMNHNKFNFFSKNRSLFFNSS